MRLSVLRAGLGRVAMGLAVVSLGFAGVATGWAQGPAMGPHRPPMERAMGPGGPHGDHGRWWNDPHSVEKYKLTDTQRKAMDDIYQQHRLTLVDLHATLEKNELEMEPMIRADQPDQGKILAQIDRIAQARAELEKANARMLLGIRKQLTPEQWKQLETDRASRRDGRDGHDGRGPRGEEHQWHRPGGPDQRGPGQHGAGADGQGGSGAGPGSGGPGEFE
jgi:protein CpxP